MLFFIEKPLSRNLMNSNSKNITTYNHSEKVVEGLFWLRIEWILRLILWKILNLVKH
jgi:hypothetical protein